LSEEYARESAAKWNTQDEQTGYVGYVTRFRLPTAYLARF
jgi:hypothetical protein